MAEIKAVSTKEAFAPAGPYSQATVTPSLIFVSGQIPLPANTASSPSSRPPQTIGEKTSLCIAHVRAILSAANSSIEKVVKTTVYLIDMERDFAGMNEEYEKWFRGAGGVGVRPARTCVEVSKLPLGVEVEIECWALP